MEDQDRRYLLTRSLKQSLTRPNDLDRLWEEYGTEPVEFDLVAAMEYYDDQRELNYSPFALAHYYLSSIAHICKCSAEVRGLMAASGRLRVMVTTVVFSSFASS